MKKIVILTLFLLNFMLNWQNGQLRLNLGMEAKAMWGIELPEVEVNPDDPDDPDPQWPDDPEDEDEEEDDILSGDDCMYGDCESSEVDDDDMKDITDLSLQELLRLLKEWNNLNWSNPKQKYMVSLSKDGILTGYIYKDANGNIRYQGFMLEEVIIITHGPKDEIQFIFTGIHTPFDPREPLSFPPIDPVPVPEGTCPPTNTGKEADKILSLNKKTEYGNGNIDSLITILRNATKVDFESGLVIAKYGNQYYVYKLPSDASYIQTGAPHEEGKGYNSVNLPFPHNLAYFAHVHYEGLIAAPSPGDIVALYEAYRDQYDNYRNNGDDEPIALEGSFVICFDGVEYLISIEDHDMLQDFIDKIYRGEIEGIERDADDISEFKNGSVFFKEYDKVFKQMDKNGYSTADATTHALSHVLNKFNTGMSIEKRNSKTKLFEKKETKETPTKKGIKYEHKECD